jgi:hypothetical protein
MTLRIVVTGLAATYPFGGVFWDYLQYAVGLRRLGHDVLYLEDTGRWCYDPARATYVEDGTANARLLAGWIDRLGAGVGWAYRDARGVWHGQPRQRAVAYCRTADLFLHLSASCWLRDEYRPAGRLAFVDTDPMYTQASFPGHAAGTIGDAERDRVDMLLGHDVHFTLGANVGRPCCSVPVGPCTWIPTRQPIVLDLFPAVDAPPRQVLTTVGSWRAHQRDLDVDGVAYGGKEAELLRFLDLPAYSELAIELALNGDAPVQTLTAHGWRLASADAVSADPWTYRDYLASSLGEWSVAKQAYVATASGWFSGRTACYLALGRPAIVQDTGFDVPTGEGLLAFSTMADAVAAIAEVAADSARHADAARALAGDMFDARRVLADLVERAFAG